MTEQMTRWQRLRAAVRGEPVDRPPVAFWRHFYEREDTVEGLAEAMVAWTRTWGWDLLKVNPRASYHVEDWGVRVRFSGQPHLKPTVVDYPVKTPADWARIEPLPIDQGVLGDHLRALRLIRQALGDEVPFIMTIFTPLSLAGDLVGADAQLRRDLQEHPRAVHRALEAITDTFVRYARACLAAGASGIFLATTSWASRNVLTDAQYQEFGRPYDLQVLAAVAEAPFNVLHVCGENNMLDLLADYPVAAVNWAATDPSNPCLADGLKLVPGAVMGGVSHAALLAETPAQVEAEIYEGFRQTDGRRWIVAGSCSIPTQSRPENLQAVWRAVTSTE